MEIFDTRRRHATVADSERALAGARWRRPPGMSEADASVLTVLTMREAVELAGCTVLCGGEEADGMTRSGRPGLPASRTRPAPDVTVTSGPGAQGLGRGAADCPRGGQRAGGANDTPLAGRGQDGRAGYAGGQWQARLPASEPRPPHAGAVTKDKGPGDSRAFPLLRRLDALAGSVGPAGGISR